MAGGALPSPCPRFATREEWEAWHQGLTWEQQMRRGELDPREHEYTDDETSKARERDERRRAQEWKPDPFSYADGRSAGSWPRVDQLDAPALSNQWRMDESAGYSAGGFAMRLHRVPHRDLARERVPVRLDADPEARLAWLRDAIERAEADQRESLLQVLRERHYRLGASPPSPTRLAMAWNQLAALRAELRALRELAHDADTAARVARRQLELF